MRKEKLLKSILVLIIGIALIAMSTNVFALSDDDLTDLTPAIDLNTTTNTNTDTNTNLNTNTETNTNINTNLDTNTNTNLNTNNYNTNLPDTGVAENTILVVALVSLAIVAIYAYAKIKYYKNI